MKWILGISDIHAGSPYGLIPPGYLLDEKKIKPKTWSDAKLDAYNYYIKTARDYWRIWIQQLKHLPPIDMLVILGDLVEGNRFRDSELIQWSGDNQSILAAEIINTAVRIVKPEHIFGVRGTPVHVTADYGIETEDKVYENIEGITQWGDSLFIEYSGLVWRLSHTCSSSSVPYGSHTPISRDIIYNMLAANLETEPDANILLYGHTHQAVSAGFPMLRKQGYTLPALKRKGEAYGRKFSKLYDVGMAVWAQDKPGDMLSDHFKKIPLTHETKLLIKVK